MRPPDSESGASSIPPRPHGGPSRARTGTRLVANEVHCHSCSGPRVPVGRIERPQAICHAVYSRAPLTNRGHRGGIGRCDRDNGRSPDPQSGVLFSCQCAVDFLPIRQMGKASPSRGGRSRTHVRRVGAGCPFQWTTPLRVCDLCGCAFGPGTQKSRPLSEAAPQRTGHLCPCYAVEGTSWG